MNFDFEWILLNREEASHFEHRGLKNAEFMKLRRLAVHPVTVADDDLKP